MNTSIEIRIYLDGEKRHEKYPTLRFPSVPRKGDEITLPDHTEAIVTCVQWMPSKDGAGMVDIVISEET